MTPKEIVDKLVSYGYKTDVFEQFNFLTYENVNTHAHKYTFNDNYEIWYYSDVDKLTAYQGYTHLITFYSMSNPKVNDYLDQLRVGKVTNKINGTEYCSCKEPKIKKTIMIVTYFNFCTECKLERL